MLTILILQQAAEQVAYFTEITEQERILHQINLAITKFETGTYDYCDFCHKIIPKIDHAIFPHATCCHLCGNKYEVYPWVTESFLSRKKNFQRIEQDGFQGK